MNALEGEEGTKGSWPSASNPNGQFILFTRVHVMYVNSLQCEIQIIVNLKLESSCTAVIIIISCPFIKRGN